MHILNLSCILAIDEGNRHEQNGKGSNSGKGLDTGAGLRKAGGGTNGLLPADELGGREGIRQQGQRSHEKLDLVLYQSITKPLKIKNQDKSFDLSCLVDDTGKISNLLEDFRKVEEFIKSIDAHSSTISQ